MTSPPQQAENGTDKVCSCAMNCIPDAILHYCASDTSSCMIDVLHLRVFLVTHDPG